MEKIKIDENGISIPKSLLKDIGMNDLSRVSIEINPKQIIISGSSDSLMQEFGYLLNEPNYGEIDWGPDVGHEKID